MFIEALKSDTRWIREEATIAELQTFANSKSIAKSIGAVSTVFLLVGGAYSYKEYGLSQGIVQSPGFLLGALGVLGIYAGVSINHIANVAQDTYESRTNQVV